MGAVVTYTYSSSVVHTYMAVYGGSTAGRKRIDHKIRVVSYSFVVYTDIQTVHRVKSRACLPQTPPPTYLAAAVPRQLFTVTSNVLHVSVIAAASRPRWLARLAWVVSTQPHREMRQQQQAQLQPQPQPQAVPRSGRPSALDSKGVVVSGSRSTRKRRRGRGSRRGAGAAAGGERGRGGEEPG